MIRALKSIFVHDQLHGVKILVAGLPEAARKKIVSRLTYMGAAAVAVQSVIEASQLIQGAYATITVPEFAPTLAKLCNPLIVLSGSDGDGLKYMQAGNARSYLTKEADFKSIRIAITEARAAKTSSLQHRLNNMAAKIGV